MLNERDKERLIYETVMRAASGISRDAQGMVEKALKTEKNPTAVSMLDSMLKNLEIAKSEGKAVCQSPGYPTVYISFGDYNLPRNCRAALNEALRDATAQGYLRPSIVDPLTRINTNDNSGKGVPNIELEYEPGLPYVEITVSLKGCGAELGNAMRIFTPAKLGENLAGLKRFVLETALEAGGKPCPPYAVGIGIGGQMDVAAKLSRKAVSARAWDDVNPDPELAGLESELLNGINRLGIGAAGTGGSTTALAVKIERAHTHTAIAPVAVNFHCWVARRAGIRIYDDGRAETIL